MLVYQCDKCGITQKAEISEYSIYKIPVIPKNWKWIDNKCFCTKCYKAIFIAAGVEF